MVQVVKEVDSKELVAEEALGGPEVGSVKLAAQAVVGAQNCVHANVVDNPWHLDLH
jgi:hypothetical protein